MNKKNKAYMGLAIASELQSFIWMLHLPKNNSMIFWLD